MLIEVKTKITHNIDNKAKRKSETFIIDKDFFAEAEYTVTELLSTQQSEGTSTVDSFEIVSLRQSSIKEIITQYEGTTSYIATLKDMFLQEDGTEKAIKYKVLLWANSISEAIQHTRDITAQGYNMSIEGLKEVNFSYLSPANEEANTTNNN